MKNETMGEKAYRLIKNKIVNTEDDCCLSIRQIAAELQMSSTPVREAFLRLHEEGLVELVPNVGFFVSRIDLKEVLKIFQVRECIELFVLRKVFNHLKEEHIQLLEKYNSVQRNSLDTGNISQYVAYDEKFHAVLIDLYNNPFISRFYRNIREQYLVCSKNIADLHTMDALEEHDQLIEHIKNKDYEKSVAALDMHIEKVKRRLKEGYIRFID
jgi:DNA-binding GntR family transcriptional regulator